MRAFVLSCVASSTLGALADAQFPVLSCSLSGGGELRFNVNSSGQQMSIGLFSKPRRQGGRVLEETWQVDNKTSLIKNFDQLMQALGKGEAHILTQTGPVELAREKGKKPTFWRHDRSVRITGCRDAEGSEVAIAEKGSSAKSGRMNENKRGPVTGKKVSH